MFTNLNGKYIMFAQLLYIYIHIYIYTDIGGDIFKPRKSFFFDDCENQDVYNCNDGKSMIYRYKVLIHSRR